jgi:hypothetical protein
MRRAICVVSLFGFCALLVGCDMDSTNESTPISPATAKEAAAKMPPPEIKTSKKK